MKRLSALLFILLLGALTACASEWESEPSETRLGLHVSTNLGASYRFVSSDVTPEMIHDTLNSLDWVNGFHQVTVVMSRGVSMEVGGSLDPQHGLSVMYRNRAERKEAVIVDPPQTVADMEGVLVSFIDNSAPWEKKYNFNVFTY